METAIWFLPKQKLSDKAVDLFEEVRSMFKDLLDMNIDFEYFKDGISTKEQVTGTKNAIMFVSLYEAICLEVFDKFVPLFKIKSSANNGLVIVPKESNARHLQDLVSQKVIIPKGIDLVSINPIILFLVKNCQVIPATISSITFGKSNYQCDQLFQDGAAAVLTNTFNYKMLNESQQKKLKVIGQFSLESDFIAVATSDFKIGKFRQNFGNWLKKHNDDFLKKGYLYAGVDQDDNNLLIEAIQGLGYNLSDFIEQYSDLVMKTISNNHAEEIKILSEKYNGLQDFNEKLVNMYKEVRESRDRLYKEIETSMGNQVLFLKDGTILGISRGFLNWTRAARQDVIGRNIADFIRPNMNKTFRELIQQIDYGLIKSFGVRNSKDNSEENPVKMDFTILELQDSKIILGIVGKKSR